MLFTLMNAKLISFSVFFSIKEKTFQITSKSLLSMAKDVYLLCSKVP